MKARDYVEVDVFNSGSLTGNPLAVVFDADELTTAQMQAFANWTNLSETTFVLQPTHAEADYRVRIFTPSTEFKFAGHPTLGTCHAWLARGGKARQADHVVQECGIGLVKVHRIADRLAFEAPPTEATQADAGLLAQVYTALGISSAEVICSAWLDNGGPPWLSLQLQSAAQVLRIEPDHAALKRLAKVGVIAPYQGSADYKALDIGLVGAGAAVDDCAYEVRAFAAAVGVYEDPVTGSLNASLARWMKQTQAMPDDYVVSQGTRMGRAGRVYVTHRAKEGLVLIGGKSSTVVTGEMRL